MEKLVVETSLAGSELSVEECNLLSVAYKNVIGSRRAAWRIISSIEQKEESRKNEEHAALVKDYRFRVELELSDVCAGILKLLDSHLTPSTAASESKVFYLKMKGDYHRYFAEFKVGAERKEAAEDTMLAYKAAQDIAVAELPPMHPIRLGLALSFSVFYYEILNSSEKACSMAKQVRIFTEMEDPLLDAIYERLKQKLYIQGSKVLYQGAPIDKMVFIVRGKMECVRDGNPTPYPTPLSEGDFCGQELLTWCLEHSSVSGNGKKMRSSGQQLLSNRTVKCLTNVEAFVLQADDLKEVAATFASFLQSLRVMVRGFGFVAQNMTFKNSAGPNRGEVVALVSESDHSSFYKCSFLGYQATL